MISFVVCSRTESDSEAMRRHLDAVLAGTPHEFVPVLSPKSIAEGYASAMAECHGDSLVFCHDDVEFIGPSVGLRLSEALAEFDVVGLAGTDRLVSPSWIAAGPPHLFGQVAQPTPSGFHVSIYGAPRSRIGGMEALDGLCLAFRREAIERLGWDAETFDGFHLYDADVTFRAHLAGFSLGVACDLPVLHRSPGAYSADWQVYARRFMDKHGPNLPPSPPHPYHYASIDVRTRDEARAAMTPRYWG